MNLSQRLAFAQLLKGRGKQRSLLQLCHAGRLVGGLSIDLRATPDEAAGALTHAMGAEALAFRIIDVKVGHPVQMDVQFQQQSVFDEPAQMRIETWEVDDVAGLVHNLNDLFRARPHVKLMAVLGEWEDMLQVWALHRSTLRSLLDDETLASARNREVLQKLLDDP
jgi:hypothetical protein